MQYSLPQYNSDSVLAVTYTVRHCVITLHHAGKDLDRFLYARVGNTVKVPGQYEQTSVGAAQHAGHYWFTPVPYKKR